MELAHLIQAIRLPLGVKMVFEAQRHRLDECLQGIKALTFSRWVESVPATFEPKVRWVHTEVSVEMRTSLAV